MNFLTTGGLVTEVEEADPAAKAGATAMAMAARRAATAIATRLMVRTRMASEYTTPAAAVTSGGAPLALPGLA